MLTVVHCVQRSRRLRIMRSTLGCRCLAGSSSSFVAERLPSGPASFSPLASPASTRRPARPKVGDGTTAFESLTVQFAGAAPNLYGLTGEYWSAPLARTTAALVAGVLHTHSIYVPRTCTIDRIGAEVTVGAVGSTITLGVYEDNGFGDPGVLLLDAGTIDGNSATAQEKTISQALTGGRVYHLAALCAGGTPTARVITGTCWMGRQISLAGATSATIRNGRSRSAIVGTALPNPAATTALASGVVIIAVRFV